MKTYKIKSIKWRGLSVGRSKGYITTIDGKTIAVVSYKGGYLVTAEDHDLYEIERKEVDTFEQAMYIANSLATREIEKYLERVDS